MALPLSTSKTTSIGMHAPFVYGGAAMERREAEIAKSIVACCGECGVGTVERHRA
jgi:hypothetical protein